jgi:CubicO group peptidase (beta-lactamase class C family)
VAGEVTRRATIAAAAAATLFAAAGVTVTSQVPVGTDSPLFSVALASAEKTIVAELAKGGAPGAAVAVVVGDKVVWAKGFGVANTETGAPVTPDTLFQIGSVTKTFTAAALVSASTQGVVALDRPVGTYVSGLTACVGAPTLSQLLSHTGGLIDEPAEFGPHGEEGLGAYQRAWTSEYCMLPPGRAFSYSNSGYALAGLALQEAEKKPFADVMRARVLDPLGMTRTTFRPTEAMTWPLAVGHRRDKEGKFTVVRPLANDARLWPAGTLYSSANDIGRLLVALVNDGRVEGKQALPPGLVDRLTDRMAEIPTTGQHYGHGLFLDRQNGHGGTMTGYVAQLGFSAANGERTGVVVLTNGDNASTTGMADAARDFALWIQNRMGGLHSDSVVGSHTLVPEIDRYVGTYRNPRRFTVEVVRQAEALILKRFGREFRMRFESPGRFSVDLPRGGTETIAFGLPAAGPADYLQMNVWALARVTP